MCTPWWPRKSRWKKFTEHLDSKFRLKFEIIVLLVLLLTFIAVVLTMHNKSFIEPAHGQTIPQTRDFDVNGVSDEMEAERLILEARMPQDASLVSNHPIGKPNLTEIIENEAKSKHLSPKIMLDLARCESHISQYNKKGDILRGYITPNDIGIFQINTEVWLNKAKELGHDVFSEEGNIKMAMFIADTAGYDEWVCFELI